MTPQEHLKQICREAGLGVMESIFEVIFDRERVPESAYFLLTAKDITEYYDYYLAPKVIDVIEDELLGDR